jgi:hypothetical protein
MNGYAHVYTALAYNTTYYWNVKARNENPNAWSQFYYSDNITVDNVPPYNGSVTYNGINTTHNFTVVNMNLGTDALSGVDYGILQRDRAPVVSSSCSGWLGYSNIGTYTTSTSTTVNLSHGYCYRFKLIVYDRAANAREYTYSNELYFYVDSTAPGPFEVNVSNTDGFIFDPILDISWTIPRDDETGISRYTYMVNDSNGNIIKQ